MNLTIHGKGLKDLDVFSKSDPMCHVHMQNYKGEWYKVDSTERIEDNLNP